MTFFSLLTYDFTDYPHFDEVDEAWGTWPSRELGLSSMFKKKTWKRHFCADFVRCWQKEGVDAFWLWILLISFKSFNTQSGLNLWHEISKLHQIHECQVVLVDFENASDIVSFYQLPSMCSSLRLSMTQLVSPNNETDMTWSMAAEDVIFLKWCIKIIGQYWAGSEYARICHLFTLYTYVAFSYRFWNSYIILIAMCHALSKSEFAFWREVSRQRLCHRH